MWGDDLRAIDSYLGWWHDAGAEDALSDAPFDWLAAPAARPSPPPPIQTTAPTRAEAPVAAPAATPLPETIEAFDAWWMADPSLPGVADAPRRIAASGPADAPLMLIADMPDPEDMAAGHLFAGPVGALLDAMLAAIGLERARVRIAALAPARAPGGRIDPAHAPALASIAAHHIRLARPRRLLILGNDTSHILSGVPVGPSIGQHKINQDGVSLAASAIHHPRLLLDRPAFKKQAWEVLKTYREPE